ncbi:hypothetical protein CORC01_06569 [Colletotrichum orchidophilum]|uniref:Uncharacterized protein n=1 Tax=Colletotrichum orchidophilum TaxID=1209926 RepID=A0A1G4B9W8_9PEZI|nr:uncharacterized protein CORC01_06569 [Colletotrichum orchidophilum]OHE98201.1 hypothetical protein CORC01_06569 [Colletotrichum orchidophilum]
MIHHSSVVDSLTRREPAPGDPCVAAPSSRYEAALSLFCQSASLDSTYHSRMARTGQWHAQMDYARMAQETLRITRTTPLFTPPMSCRQSTLAVSPASLYQNDTQ